MAGTASDFTVDLGTGAGAMAAGAAIGSAIFPGAGTVAGFVIGVVINVGINTKIGEPPKSLVDQLKDGAKKLIKNPIGAGMNFLKKGLGIVS